MNLIEVDQDLAGGRYCKCLCACDLKLSIAETLTLRTMVPPRTGHRLGLLVMSASRRRSLWLSLSARDIYDYATDGGKSTYHSADK